jgi:N-acetylmuramoyl-L-alanine amidase
VIGTHLFAAALAALSLAGSHPPAPEPHAAAARPLAGKVVGIDPGHNGGNFADPGTINAPVWNGREEEACDTTGTETDAARAPRS